MTMTCSKDRLMQYWSGELTPGEADAVARHLAACGRCSRELAGLERLASDIRDLPELTPEKNLVRKALNRIETPQRRRFWAWMPAAGVSALAAALFLVWFYLPVDRQPVPETSVALVREADIRNRLDRLALRVGHLKKRSPGFSSRQSSQDRIRRSPGMDRALNVLHHDIDRLKTCLADNCSRSFYDRLAHKRRRG